MISSSEMIADAIGWAIVGLLFNWSYWIIWIEANPHRVVRRVLGLADLGAFEQGLARAGHAGHLKDVAVVGSSPVKRPGVSGGSTAPDAATRS